MFVQVGKTARRVLSFTIVAMMMLGSLAVPAATMAQGQSLQSSLTGVTIAYSAPYTLSDEGQNADDVMETMMFVGATDVLAIGFMSPLIDLTSARDIMLEAFFGESGSAQTIDRGDYTGVSYSLDMLNIDGMEMGVFSLFMNQRAHGYSEFYIFLAPPSVFGASMQTAQNSFTIDGTQLMNGVDPMVMGNMVTANIGITGGDAVTDVTDVAGPADSETDTTETTTTTTDDTGTSSQGDQLTYVMEVMAEYTVVNTSIGNIVTALEQYTNDELSADQAFDIVNEEAEFLSGVNDRIAQIQVPAGMEDFNQETLEWAAAVTAIGTTWIAAVNGTGSQDAASEALSHGIDVHIAFGDTIQTQVISAEGSGESADTGETTETTEATEVAQTGTEAGDPSAYIESVQNHRMEFVTSLGAFNDSLATLEGEPTDADVQAALDGTLAQAEYWVGFSANAQQLTPPPGYEGVHDAYLEWAGHITELGNIWIAAMNGDDSQIDAFFDYMPIIQQADDDLQAAITEASGQDSGTDSTTADVDTSETSETTTRTTRSTGTSDDEEDTGNTSETTSRTSRSTGEADEEDDTGNTSERPSRTDRSSGSSDTDGDTGNTSETSDRTSRGGTETTAGDLPNEWLAEANGVSITWSDDFALSDHTDEPQSSDPGSGQDTVYLMTTTPAGETVRFSMMVMENPGTDSTLLIDSLVNDPAGAEDVWGAGTEVHDYNITAGASAVLMHAEDEIGAYWIYVQVTCLDSDCGTVALLEIGTEGAPLVDTLDLMESGVAVEGLNVSSALPAADVEQVVEQVGD